MNLYKFRCCTVWETKFLEHLPGNRCPLLFYTKIHSCRLIFYLLSSKCTCIGERRALVSLTVVWSKDFRIMPHLRPMKLAQSCKKLHLICPPNLGIYVNPNYLQSGNQVGRSLMLNQLEASNFFILKTEMKHPQLHYYRNLALRILLQSFTIGESFINMPVHICCQKLSSLGPIHMFKWMRQVHVRSIHFLFHILCHHICWNHATSSSPMIR